MVQAFARVRCPSCSQLARIPRESGRHACNDCGAEIAFQLAAPRTEGAQGPAREAGAGDGERAAAGASPPPLEARAAHGSQPSHPPPLPPGHEERFELARDASRALDRLKALRWLYGFGLLIHLLQVTGAISGLADPDKPAGLVGVTIFLGAMGLVLSLVVLRMLLLQPVLWSTVTAVQATLNVGLMSCGFATEGGRSVGFTVFVLIWMAWAAFTWWVVAAARRFREVSRAHPELLAVRRTAGTGHLRRSQGLSDEEWSRRLSAAAGTERKRALYGVAGFSAGILVLITGSSFAVHAGMRPKTLDSAVAGFLEAWNDQDAAELAALATAGQRERFARKLARLGDTRDWKKAWPKLVEARRSEASGRAEAVFQDPGNAELEVYVAWKRVELDWRIAELVPPHPDIAPAVASFDAAWSASDAARVAGLFPEEHRERMQRSLERRAEKSKWGAKFPALEMRGAQPRGERVEVGYECEGGMLWVRWKLDEDDRWVLSALDFP